MRIYPVRFLCEFTEPAVFPPFKGFSLRGAFGFAFRRASCSFKGRCADCLLKQACAYYSVFDIEKEDNPRGKDIPRPFVLDPPYDSKRVYSPGDKIEVVLTVFGGYVRFFPFFVLAVELLGNKGVGVPSKRGRFLVKEIVDSDGDILYSPEQKKVKMPAQLKLKEDILSESVDIKILSPLRIKKEGAYISPDRFSIDVFAEAVIRRLHLLNHLYGVFNDDVLSGANAIRRCEFSSISLRWKELERFSKRQNTKMKMGGLVGEFTLKIPSGKEREVFDVLRIAEVIHIGKNTTFGLGKISIRRRDDGER